MRRNCAPKGASAAAAEFPRGPAVASDSAGRYDPAARSCSVASAAATPTIPKLCRLQSGGAYASGVIEGRAASRRVAYAGYLGSADRPVNGEGIGRTENGAGSGLA